VAQDNSKDRASEAARERAARKQADRDITKEMDRRDRIILDKIREVQELTVRVAEANAFQFSLESSLMEISNKLSPIQDLAPSPKELDANQAHALDKIRSELARPAEPKMYLVDTYGRDLGDAAS
jgi:hypothetical protein